MQKYDKEVVQTFFEKQNELFQENVAETLEEAEEFLEDSMAVVVDSIEEVRAYFEESGVDISDMKLSDFEEAGEVFRTPSGKYLIVEG